MDNQWYVQLKIIIAITTSIAAVATVTGMDDTSMPEDTTEGTTDADTAIETYTENLPKMSSDTFPGTNEMQGKFTQHFQQ